MLLQEILTVSSSEAEKIFAMVVGIFFSRWKILEKTVWASFVSGENILFVNLVQTT